MRARYCILFLFLAQVGLGCASEEITGDTAGNVPPKVWVAIGPPERSSVGYKVHFYWGGWDSDGDVIRYEYAITNNESGVFNPADTTGADKWHPVTVADSTFLFSADLPVDSSSLDTEYQGPIPFQRSHTFFVHSVDNDGARSKAAYRSFTALNLSPVVNILEPSTGGLIVAQVPPIVTFRWTANDFYTTREETQLPDSSRSILLSMADFAFDWDVASNYIRTTPHAEQWTRWRGYDEPGDSGRFWHPKKPLAFGNYLFAVQVKDEAGAVSPVFDPARNMRRIRVSSRTTGPVLTVSNPLMSTLITSSPNAPPENIDIPSGVAIKFSWTADASGYGGTVIGYRYGWDILDLSIPSQWDIDFTPFVGGYASAPTRTFSIGTHTFYVEVKDNSGFTTRATINVNVVPFTMERGLLFVDDWDETGSAGFILTNGRLPTDDEQDAFWEQVLGNVEHDVYSPNGNARPLPLVTISHYKAVIWNTRGTPLSNTGAILTNHVMFGSTGVNVLTPFLAAGGKLLLCGDSPMTIPINKTAFAPRRGLGPAYPVIFRYELDGNQGSHPDGPGVGDQSFAYQDCCLNVIDIAWGINRNARRLSCAIGHSYDPRLEGLRTAVPVDAKYTFPRLELRPEVAGPGQFYNETQLGLQTDVYNPRYFGNYCPAAQTVPQRSCFKQMYKLECLDTTSRIYGQPIAYWSTRWAAAPNPDGIAARSAFWGFSPVYFNPDQVQEALEIIMFDEWKLAPKTALSREGVTPGE